MTREIEWRMLKDKIKNYENGNLKSKKYTTKELEEKRKYFESQELNPEFKISKKRWLYEIKRIFEMSKSFEECPDLGLTRLEFITKFGL